VSVEYHLRFVALDADIAQLPAKAIARLDYSYWPMRQGLPSPPKLLRVLAHSPPRLERALAFFQACLERAADGHRFTGASHLRGERGIGLRDGGRAQAPRRRSAEFWGK